MHQVCVLLWCNKDGHHICARSGLTILLHPQPPGQWLENNPVPESVDRVPIIKSKKTPTWRSMRPSSALLRSCIAKGCSCSIPGWCACMAPICSFKNDMLACMCVLCVCVCVFVSVCLCPSVCLSPSVCTCVVLGGVRMIVQFVCAYISARQANASYTWLPSKTDVPIR